MRTQILAGMLAALLASACAQVPALQIQTASVPTAAKEPQVRGTPVVSGRPARVYIMAGFKEADCSPIAPVIQITKPPSKGQVTLTPNQPTTIQHSGSGKCMGSKLPGTGIYYTAAKGQTGPDSFTISATTATGDTSTKTFDLQIVE